MIIVLTVCDLTQCESLPAAKEREKAAKATQNKQPGSKSTSSAVRTAASTAPAHKKSGVGTTKGAAGSKGAKSVPSSTQQDLDISGLNLDAKETPPSEEPPPKVSMSRQQLLEEVRKTLDAQDAEQKRALSLVVIGHVDAGKSTLMGRLLYELGRVDEKKRIANERGSSKIGKSSFSWAWELDGTTEERERSVHSYLLHILSFSQDQIQRDHDGYCAAIIIDASPQHHDSRRTWS